MRQTSALNNPFRPSFGVKPNHFIGRDEIVTRILQASSNLNSPWQNTILIGVRGSGKTSLLSCLREELEQRSVKIVKLRPSVELLDNILYQLRDHAGEMSSKLVVNEVKVKSPVEVTIGSATHLMVTFEEKAFYYMRKIQALGHTIAFLIDETQKYSDDLKEFIGCYEFFIEEKFNVLLVMAALPEVIQELLNTEGTTFIRRARRELLNEIPFSLVHQTFAQVFQKAGFSVKGETIRELARFTKGYPFMIQLCGYHMWNCLCDQMTDEEALTRTMQFALNDLYAYVIEPIYDSLTSREQDFLNAFVVGDKEAEVSISSVIERTGMIKQNVDTYKRRLLNYGLVHQPRRGMLSFTLPYMWAYIKQVTNDSGYDL